MSVTTSSVTGDDHKKPVSLLSLDAGGPQGISQLLILNEVMEKISKDESGDSQGIVKRPYEVFDMIGGVGTGGLIGIFLVVFKMTAKDALDEFNKFVIEVFKDVDPDPRKQTEKLTRTINGTLKRHGIAKDAKLIPTIAPAPTCKLVIPIMYKNHVGSLCVLRNYATSHEPPEDLTVAEAMLATCSTPPIFTPMTISKDFATFEYVGGDTGLSNPTRETMAEAHRIFRDERTVSCLLSIGCGHPGVNPVPNDSGVNARIEFLERAALDSEKTAHEIGTRMGHLALYHRLSVRYGLEKSQVREWKDPAVITTHTTNYLNDLDVVELVNHCVDTIKHGDGFTTLEQLTRSGATKVSSPPLPPLVANYVERKLPMEFIEKMLFEEDRRIKTGSKRIIVTGIGGCGKTQLIRKIIEKYRDLFVSTFFIDGSSPDTIRRDVVRHVRALGGAHAQKSFEESMVFLSQALNDGERLMIIDNVDDPTLDLAPFLPRWQKGTVIVTSRNHAHGQLNPACHLQLDVMTVDESVELLVRASGQHYPPTESDRNLATLVAEELGCHPIALVQAASYMYITGYSSGRYISLLCSHRERLLRDHPATSQVDMRYKTAFAAFDASYDILPPRAQSLWHLLSFFRWQRFPVELVILAASNEFSHDRFPHLTRGDEFELGKKCLQEIFYTSGQWDSLEFHSLLATLRSHSLITTTSTESATLLQMHPLVHEWGRLRIAKGDLRRFEAAAVRLLCCGASEDYFMMQHLSGHVDAISSIWHRQHANDASSLAFILAQSGVYGKAATLYSIAHEKVKRELGPNHSNTVTTSSNLAVAYARLGRYAEAEQLQTVVLDWRTQQLGTDDPLTIKATELLAVFYHDLGRYAKACELKTEVLQQQKQLLGVDHPDTVWASEQLAVTQYTLGRYAEAEELQTEVLRWRKQKLGADHPDTIRASDHLAITYHALGRHAEAEELNIEVLGRRTKLLGSGHPDTIKALSHLAGTYGQMRRYTEAVELKIEVIQKLKGLLGDDHLDTIRASASLATTYHALGDYRKAEELDTGVFMQRKKFLGADHPETIKALANLATTYYALGDYSKAEELQTEVLKKRTTLFGEGHPRTIQSMFYLAQTYSVTQRLPDASSLAESAHQIALETLGNQDPLYRRISAFLASLPNEKLTGTGYRDRFAAYLRGVLPL